MLLFFVKLYFLLQKYLLHSLIYTLKTIYINQILIRINKYENSSKLVNTLQTINQYFDLSGVIKLYI